MSSQNSEIEVENSQGVDLVEEIENKTIGTLTKELLLSDLSKHNNKQQTQLKEITNIQDEIKKLHNTQQWITNQKGNNPEAQTFNIDENAKENIEQAKDMGIQTPTINNDKLTSTQLDSLDRSINLCVEHKQNKVTTKLQASNRNLNDLNEKVSIYRLLISNLDRAIKKTAGNIR